MQLIQLIYRAYLNTRSKDNEIKANYKPINLYEE